jgi:hypothetical protein
LSILKLEGVFESFEKNSGEVSVIFPKEKQIQLNKSKYQTLDIGLVTVKEMCLLLRSNEVLKVVLRKHHQIESQFLLSNKM